MSQAHWLMLVCTLRCRKKGGVYPAVAHFLQNGTLILETGNFSSRKNFPVTSKGTKIQIFPGYAAKWINGDVMCRPLPADIITLAPLFVLSVSQSFRSGIPLWHSGTTTILFLCRMSHVKCAESSTHTRAFLESLGSSCCGSLVCRRSTTHFLCVILWYLLTTKNNSSYDEALVASSLVSAGCLKWANDALSVGSVMSYTIVIRAVGGRSVGVEYCRSLLFL